MTISSPVFVLALLILTVSVGLNLVMTFRLTAIVRPFSKGKAETVALGEMIPEFAGRRLIDEKRIASETVYGTPTVMVFLSYRCPSCTLKIPKLEMLLPRMRSKGVSLWVVAMAGNREELRSWFGNSSLLDCAIAMDKETVRRLNPQIGSPFYLFLDEAQTAVASGYFEDDDWLSFVDQMQRTEG